MLRMVDVSGLREREAQLVMIQKLMGVPRYIVSEQRMIAAFDDDCSCEALWMISHWLPLLRLWLGRGGER